MKSADRSRTPVDGCRLKNSGTSPKHSASVPHHSLLPESCQADTPSPNSQDDRRVGQMATRKVEANRAESEDLYPYAATRSPEIKGERARSVTPSNRTLLPASSFVEASQEACQDPVKTDLAPLVFPRRFASI